MFSFYSVTLQNLPRYLGKQTLEIYVSKGCPLTSWLRGGSAGPYLKIVATGAEHQERIITAKLSCHRFPRTQLPPAVTACENSTALQFGLPKQWVHIFARYIVTGQNYGQNADRRYEKLCIYCRIAATESRDTRSEGLKTAGRAP